DGLLAEQGAIESSVDVRAALVMLKGDAYVCGILGQRRVQTRMGYGDLAWTAGIRRVRSRGSQLRRSGGRPSIPGRQLGTTGLQKFAKRDVVFHSQKYWKDRAGHPAWRILARWRNECKRIASSIPAHV